MPTHISDLPVYGKEKERSTGSPGDTHLEIRTTAYHAGQWELVRSEIRRYRYDTDLVLILILW